MDKPFEYLNYPRRLPLRSSRGARSRIGEEDSGATETSGLSRGAGRADSEMERANRRLAGALRAQAEAAREKVEQLEEEAARRALEEGRLRQRARSLQRLALELSLAEDRERERLAKGPSEDLQQVLAACRFHLGILGNGLIGDPSQQSLASLVDRLIQDALAISHDLSLELCPVAYCGSGLGELMRRLAHRLQTRQRLLVHVEVPDDLDTPSEALKGFVFRTARELLLNVVKHAGVGEARLRVKRIGRRLYLAVQDRGRGFDPLKTPKAPGYGLFSIRERAASLGGRMRIRSAPGEGCTLVVSLEEESFRDEDAHREPSSFY